MLGSANSPDGEVVFIGPAAEHAFGRRHFMGMTAAFTAPPPGRSWKVN